MIGALVRLYPAAWRDRYGDEFLALLEERGLGPFDVADIALGAFDAHLRRRGLRVAASPGKGLSMSLRIGGVAAMLGAVLWPGGFFLASSGLMAGPLPTLAILAGTAMLLVALTGLSAFQARRHPVLTWAAFVIPSLGYVVSIAGIVGMAVIGDRPFIGGFSPWSVWMVGVLAALAGSILFAVVTYRTAALSTKASVILGVGATGLLVLMALGSAGVDWVTADPALLTVALLGLILTVDVAWFALGLDAVRRGRPRPLSTTA